MIFTPLELDRAWVIDIEPKEDDRGFFARVWCQREVAAQGLDTGIVQESISVSRRRGSLRGFHFQRAPHEENKVVSCTRGAIFDVLVDLRPGSPTFLRWQAIELTAENHRAVYIPQGCAHAFQTLTDDVEVAYRISAFYAPEAAGGYRYDDPAFAVTWPLAVSVISERDLAWPRYQCPDSR